MQKHTKRKKNTVWTKIITFLFAFYITIIQIKQFMCAPELLKIKNKEKIIVTTMLQTKTRENW